MEEEGDSKNKSNKLSKKNSSKVNNPDKRDPFPGTS